MTMEFDMARERLRSAVLKARVGSPSASESAVPDALDSSNQADGLSGVPSGHITYRRASNIQAKPINWLWPSRIARGKVSMLAGNPGLGKSQVTANMAATVSVGGSWPLDGASCELGNVVILSAEDDPEDTIRPRLEAAGADLSRVFILEAVVEPLTGGAKELRRAFNLKTDLDRLGVMLTDIGGAALIVIDPVTAYLGATDSHKNAEIRALLAPLSDMAGKHGAAVVCVSHFNKASGGEALMKVTGSLAFVAAARAAFVIVKDPEDEHRRLFLPMKNNLGNDHSGLAFTVQSAQVESPTGIIETSRVVWEAGVVAVTADQAIASQGIQEDRGELTGAIEFLREELTDGGVLVKQLRKAADNAGQAWRTVQRAKTVLGVVSSKQGMLGGWIWRLPERSESEERQECLKSATQYEWRPSDSVGALRGKNAEEVEIEI